MWNMNRKTKLILAEISDSGSWTQISWFKCENLSLCSQVTGSLESCCPPDTSQVKMALFGTACSTGDTRWPSDLHASPLLACERNLSQQVKRQKIATSERSLLLAGIETQTAHESVFVLCLFLLDWILASNLHPVVTIVWKNLQRGTRSASTRLLPLHAVFLLSRLGQFGIKFIMSVCDHSAAPSTITF